MKITVNTTKETITVHGSFLFEDFKKMFEELPERWKMFAFIGSDEDTIIKFGPNPPVPPQIGSPYYPVMPYQPPTPTFRCCGNCVICPYSTQITCKSDD